MIVKHTKQGWEIVYQYAHGLLAGQIANQLRHDLRPQLWVETLTAIVEHDDNQLDFDEKNYLTNIGTPLHFTEDESDASKTLEQAKRVVETASHKSGWIALLISMHADFLYSELAKSDADFKVFLDGQHELRKELRKRYKINESQAKEYYRLLLFCDRCSLILCQEQVPSAGRSLEINQTIENKTYFIKAVDENCFTIEPWCFQDDSFTVSIERQRVGQTKFNSNKELKKALENCTVDLKEWKFVRQG